MLNKIKVAAEEYLAAEINLAETDYLLNNQRPKTIEEQKAMEEAILDSVNAVGELREVYRSYISELGTIDHQKIDFFELFNLDEYENIKNALIDMAKAEELNETVFNSVVHSVVGLSPKINGLGLSTGKCIDYINELAVSANTVENNMSGMTDEIENIDEKLQSFSDTISSYESSITNMVLYADRTIEGCDGIGDSQGKIISQTKNERTVIVGGRINMYKWNEELNDGYGGWEREGAVYTNVNADGGICLSSSGGRPVLFAAGGSILAKIFPPETETDGDGNRRRKYVRKKIPL